MNTYQGSSSIDFFIEFIANSPTKIIYNLHVAWRFYTSTCFALPEAASSPIVLCITDEVSLLGELFQKPFPIQGIECTKRIISSY